MKTKLYNNDSGGSVPFSVKLKYFLFKHYWWMLGVLIVSVSFLLWINGASIQVALPPIATLLSLVYFIQKQKLEELRFSREIFKSCNEAYNKLNEELAKINNIRSSDQLNENEKKVLVDYFNLCGEEYFYFHHGFIYPDVWDAWRNGIRFYLKNDRIKRFWVEELETNSYYGMPRDL